VTFLGRPYSNLEPSAGAATTPLPAAPPACCVMDLAAVHWLAVNSNIVWQADVNPMSSEAVPI
jgi:hypothetical protein